MDLSALTIDQLQAEHAERDLQISNLRQEQQAIHDEIVAKERLAFRASSAGVQTLTQPDSDVDRWFKSLTQDAQARVKKFFGKGEES